MKPPQVKRKGSLYLNEDSYNQSKAEKEISEKLRTKIGQIDIPDFKDNVAPLY